MTERKKDGTVRFLDAAWDVNPKQLEGFAAGDKVVACVPFRSIELLDHEDEGVISGEVHFLLFKGNHYHLTIRTDSGEDIFIYTNDVWDKGDRVGIKIAPDEIRIVQRINDDKSAE